MKVKRFLKRTLIVVAGSFIGLIGGIITGLGISSVFDSVLRALYNPHPWGWLLLFGVAISAWTGCIVGAGTSALGVRTVSGFEWAIITAVAFPLGCLITDIPWNWSFIFILAGIGATASWLIVLIVRKILGLQLSKGPIHSGIFAGYLLVFILIMFTTPSILSALRQGLG